MLESWFQWLGALPVSQAISASAWIYPFVQAIHLLFLALFAGALLVVDLRLLGFGMRAQALSKVARDARPWLIVGFLGLVVTGIPQLMQNAMREYYSEYFWLKMRVMPAALVFTFVIRHKITMADEARIGPLWGKAVAITSMLLWFGGVTIPARLIGLFT
jgi:hypothetical protein